MLETHHQTTPGCFWLTPTHLEMSLGHFLQEENSHASRTLPRVNATFSIVSSCDFRQISYLFPAPFSEKVTKFASDLSPSKVEVSQEHLNRGQWICKIVKTGEINSVQL